MPRRAGPAPPTPPGTGPALLEAVPAHLARPQANGKRFWEDECACFHTPAWWKRSWTGSGRVRDVKADLPRDGWRYWRDFERALALSGKARFSSDAEALQRDRGRYLGFVRVTARRNDSAGENLYDPSIGVRVGVDG